MHTYVCPMEQRKERTYINVLSVPFVLSSLVRSFFCTCGYLAFDGIGVDIYIYIYVHTYIRREYRRTFIFKLISFLSKLTNLIINGSFFSFD